MKRDTEPCAFQGRHRAKIDRRIARYRETITSQGNPLDRAKKKKKKKKKKKDSNRLRDTEISREREKKRLTIYIYIYVYLDVSEK